MPYGGAGDSGTPDDAKEFINDMNDDGNDNFWGGTFGKTSCLYKYKYNFIIDLFLKTLCCVPAGINR